MRAAVPADTVIEHFVHGALCVAFSGQCYISHAHTGRSANRGDCSQACRLPYTLQDAQGRVVAFDKHLLSVKDNNQSANLARPDRRRRARASRSRAATRISATSRTSPATTDGCSTPFSADRPDLAPASSGRTRLLFTPNPDKTFHRGATDYFSRGRQADIGAFDTPAFVGLPLGTVTRVGADWFELETADSLANGDGLTYLHKREVVGIQANVVEHDRRRPLAGLAERADAQPCQDSRSGVGHQPQPRPCLGTGPDARSPPSDASTSGPPSPTPTTVSP